MNALTPLLFQPAEFLTTPDGPTLLELGKLVGGFRVPLHANFDGVAECADLSPDRQRDRVEAAELHAFEIDLDQRFAAVDARVVGEGRPQRDDQIGFVHKPAGNRGTGPPQYTRSVGVTVGDQTLALERGQHRRAQCLSQPDHLFSRPGGPIAHDDNGTFRRIDHGCRVFEIGITGHDNRPPHPACGSRGLGVAGHGLDIVRKDEVCHVALGEGGLAGQRHQFRVFRAAERRLRESRNRIER